MIEINLKNFLAASKNINMKQESSIKMLESMTGNIKELADESYSSAKKKRSAKSKVKKIILKEIEQRIILVLN